MTKRLLSTCFFALFAGLGVLFIAASSPHAVQAETPAATTAEYRITFSANWSNNTHPLPNFPASAHWSPLAGMTHNASTSVWEPGMWASAGIESVAETGGTSTLLGEYNSKVSLGTADVWIQSSFSPFSGVSSASKDITASSDFPLLSVVSMIAPSPDWFAGVHDLSLLDGSNNWEESITVQLYPYDAGTEEGTAYNGNNPSTIPQGVITSLRNVSPFSGEPVGTLTVTLLEPPTSVALAGVQADSGASSLLLIVVFMLGLLVLTAVRSKVGIRPVKV